ncbi:MAG: excinuclease ABC subunit UvrC [Gammaproteobacteria bacterium]
MIHDFSKVPRNPGVYQFFDKKEIIYIGKAKNLNKRVRSYFTKAIKDRKTEQIKQQAQRVETFTTHTETEALILEQQLIKEYKPKFNILLRDDKTYPFIFFSSKHDYPSIQLKRSKQSLSEDYYGPYTSAKLVKDQLKELQKIFKLRNCEDSTFANRSRPCIEYQMKRCSAPCVKLISKADYAEDISSAKEYLTAEKKQLKNQLINKMETHAAKLEFEEAEHVHKRLLRINALEQEAAVSIKPITLDIWHASFSKHASGIAKLSVRDGRIQATKTYFLDENHANNIDEMFQSVLFHHYRFLQNLPRKLLIVNQLKENKLLKKAIEKKFATTSTFLNHTPKGGAPFVRLTKLNSSQAILNQQAKTAIFKQAFEELQKLCNKGTNKLILDCIDISHHSGFHPKAAIVRFNINGPVKKYYRAYNIPKHLGANDTGSIIFALNKRLHQKNTPPSVLLIDGGEQQLNAAKHADNINNIVLLAIKKGSNRKAYTETIYSAKGQEDISIRSELYKLLTKARDEAHRFAIKANRNAKLSSIKGGKLDTIKGIGPFKRNMLIKKYGSVKNILKQPHSELSSNPGINEALANAILEIT